MKAKVIFVVAKTEQFTFADVCMNLTILYLGDMCLPAKQQLSSFLPAERADMLKPERVAALSSRTSVALPEQPD